MERARVAAESYSTALSAHMIAELLHSRHSWAFDFPGIPAFFAVKHLWSDFESLRYLHQSAP